MYAFNSANISRKLSEHKTSALHTRLNSNSFKRKEEFASDYRTVLNVRNMATCSSLLNIIIVLETLVKATQGIDHSMIIDTIMNMGRGECK